MAQLKREATDKATGGQKKPQTVYVLTSVREQQVPGQELIRLTRAF